MFLCSLLGLRRFGCEFKFEQKNIKLIVKVTSLSEKVQYYGYYRECSNYAEVKSQFLHLFIIFGPLCLVFKKTCECCYRQHCRLRVDVCSTFGTLKLLDRYTYIP